MTPSKERALVKKVEGMVKEIAIANEKINKQQTKQIKDLQQRVDALEDAQEKANKSKANKKK
jgi:uncharacterized protein YbjQ (UPF0145 family)